MSPRNTINLCMPTAKQANEIIGAFEDFKRCRLGKVQGPTVFKVLSGQCMFYYIY